MVLIDDSNKKREGSQNFIQICPFNETNISTVGMEALQSEF